MYLQAGNEDKVLRVIPTSLLFKMNLKTRILFHRTRNEDIEKEIQNLNVNKACQYPDIPTKIIKENSDVHADFLCKSINNSIKASLFPSRLKNADITPTHKKEQKERL